MTPTADDIFARARAVSIEAVAGVPLFRAGRRMRGGCPICGASAGKKADGAFSVDPEAGLFHCFACQRGGDVVALERARGGGSARQSAERLVGGSPAPRTRAARPERRTPPDKPGLDLEIWRSARGRVAGSPAAVYLEGRGIDPRLIAGIQGYVRFAEAAIWGWNEAGEKISAPAMVARPITHSGLVPGCHVTYLAPGGHGKARLTPAKKMWGRQADAEGRPGAVWLTDPEAEGPLLVAEGIESALSAAQLLGQPCRIVATLSLARLQGGLLTDKWGRISPAAVAADPERPPWTWPEPGEVILAVDRDMGAIRAKVRKTGGGTAERLLTAEDRARICAGLAKQAWKRAGATKVRVIAPGPGRDFNDELRARQDG
jgi:hypothetical protein